MEKQKDKYIKKDVSDLMIRNIRNYYEGKLKEKPSTIQIIAFGISCFALGISLSKLLIK